MAIQLFAEGKDHVVRGVPCKVKNVRPSSVQEYLKKGWKYDVTELKAGKKVVVEEKDAADLKVVPKVDKKD